MSRVPTFDLRVNLFCSSSASSVTSPGVRNTDYFRASLQPVSVCDPLSSWYESDDSVSSENQTHVLFILFMSPLVSPSEEADFFSKGTKHSSLTKKNRQKVQFCLLQTAQVRVCCICWRTATAFFVNKTAERWSHWVETMFDPTED